MTDSPSANPVRTLEPHFIVHLCGRQDLRPEDTWKCTPTQKDCYVTQGCLWLVRMQSERRRFPHRSVAHAMTLTTMLVLIQHAASDGYWQTTSADLLAPVF